MNLQELKEQWISLVVLHTHIDKYNVGDYGASIPCENVWVDSEALYLDYLHYLAKQGACFPADDQTLPSSRNAVNKSYNDYMLGQEDMVKSGFKRVISLKSMLEAEK